MPEIKINQVSVNSYSSQIFPQKITHTSRENSPSKQAMKEDFPIQHPSKTRVLLKEDDTDGAYKPASDKNEYSELMELANMRQNAMKLNYYKKKE